MDKIFAACNISTGKNYNTFYISALLW